MKLVSLLAPFSVYIFHFPTALVVLGCLHVPTLSCCTNLQKETELRTKITIRKKKD